MQNRTMIIIAVTLFAIAALLVVAISVAFYVSSSKTYPAPVLTRTVPANRKITSKLLKTKQFDQPPADNIITESDKIVGKVAARELSAGAKLTPDDFREKFKIIKSTSSIPAGNRIDRSMVKKAFVAEKPDNAVEKTEWLVGRMVRSGIPANVSVRSTHVYEEEQKIVVATRQIKANTLVRSEQLKVVSRPVFPEDAVTDKEQLVGRAIKNRKSPGDVLRKSDLYEGKMQLSYFIPLYKRAKTLDVDVSRSVAYQLRPGDLVDLYVYQPRNYSSAKAQEAATVGSEIHVLQKVADATEILALNKQNQNVWSKDKLQKIKNNQKKKGGGKMTYNGVTLAVTLKEAEKISLIQGMKSEGEKMHFYLILRPRIQKSKYGRRKVTGLEIFNREGGLEANEYLESRPVTVIQGEEEKVHKVPGYR